MFLHSLHRKKRHILAIALVRALTFQDQTIYTNDIALQKHLGIN